MGYKKLTDANGNPVRMVFGNPTDAQVKTAIIEAIVNGEIELPNVSSGGTLTHSMSDDWIANAETAYAHVLAEMKLYGNDAIPFFVQTDLHGRNNDPARWMHNKDKRVKNINLGDNSVDHYGVWDAENYRASALPVQNLITVFGNHDANSYGEVPEEEYAATEYNLKYYYTDTTSAGKRMVNGRNFFVSHDDNFNVKYIVVCPYYSDSTGLRAGVRIDTDQMEWLLKELSLDDGYDIVLLMHQLWTDTHYHRDGTLQEWGDAPTVLQNLWTVLKDRRNKRSGTITDSSGVEHSYDFTACTSRILCSLHGHSHEELMLSEDGMTAYVADWYGDNNSCVFGIIDRVNNKLKIWEFKTTGVSDLLELEI